ncbi:hypothetical protein BVRB_5g118900 isoform A [Beta vulgaris subsp. vulgaris]|nr:hypothetical protein BVRB_5g118900 isoform A [Beta vulgaris subsp. vulgaris]
MLELRSWMFLPARPSESRCFALLLYWEMYFLMQYIMVVY